MAEKMDLDPIHFGPFTLDQSARQLRRGGQAVELNARYFDALCLLVRAPGALVTKDQFMDMVWRGIPVTDDALTQCIRSLRRALDDDAAHPRYIATVPKYGYRFIGDVQREPGPAIGAPAAPLQAQGHTATVLNGLLGGALAGGVGGIAYGMAAASGTAMVGGASVFIVLVVITTAIAALGAAGVSGGIALAQARMPGSGAAAALGAASGGLIIGAVTKLIGGDALTLLFGQAPASMTGAGEGALLGGAVGMALWWARTARGWRTRVGGAAVIGASAGALITAMGGVLFAGSLASLGANYPGGAIDLGRIGSLLGEPGFGTASRYVTAMLESAIFAAAMVWALARRPLGNAA